MTIVIENIGHDGVKAWCQFHDSAELVTRKCELSWADIDHYAIVDRISLNTAIEAIRQKMIWIEKHPIG